MEKFYRKIIGGNTAIMRILFIRGAFLNKFEGQNYEPLVKDHQIVGVGSLTSIHKKFDFPVKLFFSPYDLINAIGRIDRRLIGKIGEKITRGFLNRTLGDPHFLWGLEKFVKDKGNRRNKGNRGWDVGHMAETYYGYDWQVVRLKQRGCIKKIVSTCWETIPFNNETIVKKKRIKEIVKKNTDLFICLTQRAKRALVVEGINEERIGVIRMGVDLSRFRVQGSRFKVNKKEVVILFVGRLVEEKGVGDLYEAYKNIKYQSVSWRTNIKNTNKKLKINKIRLRIVGDGYLKEMLVNRIRKDGLEDNVFIEKKLYEEMPQVYQEADVLVVPSKTSQTWEEQYGMVLVEAMASGLPIIAYKSGAIAEVLGNAGILVKEGWVKDLTVAINGLIETNDLRIKLGKMGRIRAEKEFDKEKVAKKIEQIYEKL